MALAQKKVDRREITDKVELWKEMEMAHFLSMDNYRNIVKFIYNHHNELVLEMTDVRRLIGIMSDEDDHYYVLEDIKGKKTWSSCVGGLIILKNKINNDEYEYLESLFVRNHENIMMIHPTTEEQVEFKKFFQIQDSH